MEANKEIFEPINEDFDTELELFQKEQDAISNKKKNKFKKK